VRLRLGTRGSQLALWQARAVAARIAACGGPECEIVPIRTTGDRLAEAPLGEVGGKRIFVREIEEALLAGTVDLAVHSAKDMPSDLPDGLEIGGVLPREDPRDAIVAGGSRSALPAGVAELVAALGARPRVGTGSVRRVTQLRRLLPGGIFQPIRGNLDTRLRKLDAGEHDVLVLASAGLLRLGAGDRISARLPVTACVPAPGQGIVAVEIRAGDSRVQEALAGASDGPVAVALAAERALVAALGGGCQLPLGALAQPDADGLHLVGVVLSPDGARALRAQARGPAAEAAALGRQVAGELLAQGAAGILDEARGVAAQTEGSP
jgi:hydroxymethylbilane synthase